MRKDIYGYVKRLAHFLDDNGVCGLVWSTHVHGETIKIYTCEHYTSVQVNDTVVDLDEFDEAFPVKE